MCVTCLFEDHDLSLLSTKHVALCTNCNTKLTQRKHTIQSKHNQTRQTSEKCWFIILDFLRYYDKRDAAKACGLQDRNLRVWQDQKDLESFGLSKI
jgi:NMD protein affecting ribosome stability and mRNA decay